MNLTKYIGLGLIFLNISTPTLSYAQNPRQTLLYTCQRLFESFYQVVNQKIALNNLVDLSTLELKKGKHQIQVTHNRELIAYQLTGSGTELALVKNNFDHTFPGADYPITIGDAWIIRKLATPLSNPQKLQQFIASSSSHFKIAIPLDRLDNQGIEFIHPLSATIQFTTESSEASRNAFFQQHGLEVTHAFGFPVDSPMFQIKTSPTNPAFIIDLLPSLAATGKIKWIEAAFFERIGPRSRL